MSDVEAGLAHDPDEVCTEYVDPQHDPWCALVLPVLKLMPAKVPSAGWGCVGIVERALTASRSRHRIGADPLLDAPTTQDESEADHAPGAPPFRSCHG